VFEEKNYDKSNIIGQIRKNNVLSYKSETNQHPAPSTQQQELINLNEIK
jgi:hypothetical protein